MVLDRIVTLALALLALAQAPSTQKFFTSPYSAADVAGKRAVVETTMGTFVIALHGEQAPNHVGYFIKLARDGAYDGTTLHRVIKYGLIQGGDPLSKDPAKSAQYGTGGLNMLRPEIGREPMTAGAVGAVLLPGRPTSAGAQFFVCATDQPTLQGQYTVFGRVVEGIEVVQQISAVPADAQQRPAERIVIKSVTIRDPPPPVTDPLDEATPADLAKYRAVLETTKGEIELQFLTDKAPATVRQFLRLARAGVFDSTLVHRVVPDFVFQTGALAHRDQPLTAAQHKLVINQSPEFSDVKHEPGVVSMARGEDPASATTSFFVCTGACSSLDGKYTAFARVSRGMDIVQAIATVAVDGETPKEKILLTRVRIIGPSSH
jgi:cyclophilin family peptidyl-prolyl cis-trans isomerase